MIKKLEADLMSLAHRVLQLKNKEDIAVLCAETQKLHEKLLVLQVVTTHFSDVKPTIGQAEMMQQLEAVLENDSNFELPNKESTKIVEHEIQDIAIEIKDGENEIIANEEVASFLDVEFAEELTIEPEALETVAVLNFEAPVETKTPTILFEEVAPQSHAVQISFEDLLGSSIDESFFVKIEDNQKTSEFDFELPKIDQTAIETPVLKEESSVSSTKNEEILVAKPIQPLLIGLNDKVAFVKHLFGNSNEDYNRVLNQIITFDNLADVQQFISDMVKPDYNNWDGKDEYAERFMEIIEKKF